MNKMIRLKSISTIIFSVFCLYMLTACSDKKQPKKITYRPVAYITMQPSTQHSLDYYSGNIKAANGVALSFRKTGTVSKVHVKVGDRVKYGEMLMSLDHTKTVLSIEKAMTQKESLLAQMNIQKSNFQRIENLYAKDLIALNDYEVAKNSLTRANADYITACREHELLQEELQYERIYAPQSGVIAEVLVEKNETVTSGTSMVKMNVGNALEVMVNLPDQMINQVKKGNHYKMNIPAIDVHHLDGIVTEVAPNVNQSTGLYGMTLQLISPLSNIREGMVAKVMISPTNIDKSALRVPMTSLIEKESKHFVFVLTPINDSLAVAELRHVTVGKNSSSGMTILKGLKKGDRIATAGLQTLMDKQKVLIK
ncbi:efflux RND transporter periplasmic adaptor subunit [Prolixibacteraceae bacterium]|nr:efflux RND transporter periplasmic adaptor subunit [Prolixibacteraceae bacterium]